jgi:quercetin dioxygenase-like cupin family protein
MRGGPHTLAGRDGEEIMTTIARRPALALGLAAAAAPIAAGDAGAQMQMGGGSEGNEVAPGVREVPLGKGPSILPGYKTVSMLDVVIQPGSNVPNDTMKNDMVCHVAEGELRVVQDGKELRFKKGDVWTCAKGTAEQTFNDGSTVAVMRVIDLLTT